MSTEPMINEEVGYLDATNGLGKNITPTNKTAVIAQAETECIKRPPQLFLTAVVGTLLFVSICVVVILASSGNLPPAQDKLIEGLFDLAKISFGTIVGL